MQKPTNPPTHIRSGTLYKLYAYQRHLLPQSHGFAAGGDLRLVTQAWSERGWPSGGPSRLFGDTERSLEALFRLVMYSFFSHEHINPLSSCYSHEHINTNQ